MSSSVNIASYLPRVAAEQPHAMAIVCPCGRDAAGRVVYSHLTRRQLDQLSDKLARGLERQGIGRGVRTVLMVPPGLDLFPLAFALFKVGAVPVMVDPGIGLKHLKSCLGKAEPQAFIGVAKAHAARIILGWALGSGLSSFSKFEQNTCCLNIIDVDTDPETGALVRTLVRGVNHTAYNPTRHDDHLTTLEVGVARMLKRME